MYTGANAQVRTVYGNSRPTCFEIKVGMQQGSVLSSLLFVIVMEALSREFGVTLSWELNADDLVVIAKTEEPVCQFFQKVSLVTVGYRGLMETGSNGLSNEGVIGL